MCNSDPEVVLTNFIRIKGVCKVGATFFVKELECCDCLSDAEIARGVRCRVVQGHGRPGNFTLKMQFPAF